MLTRDKSKAPALEGKGIEAFVGDLARPETLGATFEGVDRVFHLTPNSAEGIALGANLIDAAKESGNEVRIVRLSTLKASREGPSRLSKQHAEVEDVLTSSGLPYTILRPVYFMQNTMAAARTVAWRARSTSPWGRGRSA